MADVGHHPLTDLDWEAAWAPYDEATYAAALEYITPGDVVLAVPFPPAITVGVLLMRHCRHFREYVSKLRGSGCARLITNARWKMGVEHIAFNQLRLPFENLRAGWYACLCGATGFAAASAQALTDEALDRVCEVEDCPNCRGHAGQSRGVPRPTQKP